METASEDLTSEAEMTRELQEALERAADLSEDQQRLIASAVLRQIEAAAVSLERLARQIARNPNSLLTGR